MNGQEAYENFCRNTGQKAKWVKHFVPVLLPIYNTLFKEGAKTRRQRRKNFDRIMHEKGIWGLSGEMDNLFEAFEKLFEVLTED